MIAAESWHHTVSAGLTLELLQCPPCHTAHASTGHYAMRRHTKHVCTRCGNVFSIASQLACVGNPLASLPMLTSINGKLSVDGGPLGGDGSGPGVADGIAGGCLAIGKPSSCLVAAVGHLAGSCEVAAVSIGTPPVWGMVAPRWHMTRKLRRPWNAADPSRCGACGGVSMIV